MSTTIIQRYQNCAFMLMERNDANYRFLGTAFVVHEDGYLLTAAHAIQGADNLVAVNAFQPGSPSPLFREDANTYELMVARTDEQRDLALLKMDIPEQISVPDNYMGNPENVDEGSMLLTFGVSFGHFRIHRVLTMEAMLSGRLVTPNGTDIILFDKLVHPGDVGGPVIAADEGRIVGVMQGNFNPLHIQSIEHPEDYDLRSSHSYAVSITYARQLLEDEGLQFNTAFIVQPEGAPS